MIAYMIVDINGYRWYYDSKEEMLESVRLGNTFLGKIELDPEVWSYYELFGTPHMLRDANDDLYDVHHETNDE